MKRLAYLLLLVIILASCSAPKNIAYFQDRNPGSQEEVTVNAVPFKVRPGDRLSIYVKSRNSQLTNQFNLYTTVQQNGGSNASSYIVDDNGEIQFPVLGNIKVAGKNRQEIINFLSDTLRSTQLVDDAIVQVEYTGLYVTVLGQSGGRRINIDKDKLTLFELIAMCGDLNMDSKRQNILIIREEDGVRSQYEVDLTTMKNVYESPAYYVHQNDIVYIEPSDKAKRSSTVNGNLFQTWGFWTGLTGLFMSVYSLINLFVK
ncbi:MAG: polysaccharide biosynthesis/export family protein [Prevotella sp.]|nr:polysaccharide biosynthesis/export family protein [Candidatus Prevotella equi]